MQPTTGDRDHRSIALQECVLLDGAVESVKRINRTVALIESRRMITQHPVGHGHFCRQGLQRIEPLVGVVHRSLQLPVLLFKSFLVVAEGVVIPNLPKHSRIGANRYGNANRPNERQHANSMEQIGRHDKLFELTWGRRDIERIALTPHKRQGL